MRTGCGALLLGAAVGLAACGGSSHSHSGTSSQATTPPASAATASTATSGPSPPVGTGGPLRCRAAGLTLRFLGQQGATGRGELGFALRNSSSSSCRTFGFPGILFLDRAGNGLPSVPLHRTHDPFGSAPATVLILAPGASASFRLGVTHGIVSSVGCTTAYGLQVIPPDDTKSLRVSIPGGAYECRQTTVSPLRPGTTAYP